MAITATAGKKLAEQEAARRSALAGRFSITPLFGVRARQIALITLFVVAVISVTTIANIAYLTGVIINGTEKQASQLSDQITYAIRREFPPEMLDYENPYIEIAKEQSEVRGLMESIIATSKPIIYLYLTDANGEIITDAKSNLKLAVNQHTIGDASATPDIKELAGQSAYVQLYRVFFGPRVYEYRKRLTSDDSIPGELHIGVSANTLRSEALSPITTNLFIGLFAILGATLVAMTSANLLLRPLKEISTSIERIESGAEPEHKVNLPRDHAVTGVTTRLRQLSERVAGERSELEIMRGRLRQVISHLEERLLLINREGRVILASPDAERLLGIKDYEIGGLPIDESLGATHPLVGLIEQAFAERRSITRAALSVPDGTKARQLIVSVQYIEDAGEPVGALVSLRDYESIQRFETQWDLSKKLADLGRITSGIAHEVKNPLNAMVIHLEILRSKIESGAGDPTPQMEILDSEIKRLDRVVATFLNFTRPVEVRLQPLDFNSIVNQVVLLASTEASERGVAISREMVEGPMMIKGDADLLKQALLNIIINGCQAMPEGGPLKVATFRGADGSVRIKISDRGVGIPAEARDQIFNLYHTTKKGGSGIGLAQAYRAVQLHNGVIRFESEVGVGTTFEIILPEVN
ncbi:MAG TPA: ATP-binding protein [Blastocatellia bacterium]|jgi:PAS domain S-box-containing protein